MPIEVERFVMVDYVPLRNYNCRVALMERRGWVMTPTEHRANFRADGAEDVGRFIAEFCLRFNAPPLIEVDSSIAGRIYEIIKRYLGGPEQFPRPEPKMSDEEWTIRHHHHRLRQL